MTRVQADITLKSLWSGQPEITELAIVRPILNLPLRRERSAQPLPSSQPRRPPATATPRRSRSIASR